MSEKVIVPLRQLGSRSLVIKSHLVAALGEVSPIERGLFRLGTGNTDPLLLLSGQFVGTTLFLFFAFAGTQYVCRRLHCPCRWRRADRSSFSSSLFHFPFSFSSVANSPANSITGQTTSGLNGSTISTVNTSSRKSRPACESVSSPGQSRAHRAALRPTVLYIAFAFGMSLTATAWCMSRVSGSLYNPAVSCAEVSLTRLPLTEEILTRLGLRD